MAGYRRNHFAASAAQLFFSCGALRGFLKRILNDAALFLMQSEQDASRLLDLELNRNESLSRAI